MNHDLTATAELELSENQIMSILNNLTNDNFLKLFNEQQIQRNLSITGEELLHTIDHRGKSKVYDEGVLNYTTDLDTFSFGKSNRKIIQKKVDEICKTIEEYGIIVPIIVDKKLEIGEGQHRVKALMKYNENNPNNKKGIYFIIRKKIPPQTVKVMNRTFTNWKNPDYLHSYVEDGLPEYIKLKNFIEKNKEFTFYFCTAMCQNDLSGVDRHGGKSNIKHNTHQSMKDKFEQGLWTVASDDPNLERAQRYADDIKKVTKVCNITSQHFYFALLNLLMNVPKFDLNRFINKLQENYLYYHKVQIHNREQAYDLINAVYNVKSKKKNEEELNILQFWNNKKRRKKTVNE
jgi:hypothetical protein